MGIGVREMFAAVRTMARGPLARYAGQRCSETARFEQELADHTGASYALAVNSGTSALVCALAGLGVGPGDEVLVPAYTWVSTPASVLAVGAVPILVDVDESLTIDPLDMKRKMTARTRAVIPVHMLNLVCDLDAIMSIAGEHGLFVVEDACQAVGVAYRHGKVGALGHAGAFSFNHHKNIRSGEGGALLTSDRRIYERAAMYHDVGRYTRPDWVAMDEPLFVGLNLRMPELSSAILRPQLARLERQMERRKARRRVLVEALRRQPGLSISPHHDPDTAVGLTVMLETPDAAKAFAQSPGVNRLVDTGRHVYTNWHSICTKRTYHPAIDPYTWAYGTHRSEPLSCPRTLGVLERTCSVSLDPDVPLPVFRMMARRMLN